MCVTDEACILQEVVQPKCCFSDVLWVLQCFSLKRVAVFVQERVSDNQ